MAGIQGFVVFCLGIIISIMGAAKVPSEGAKWPDTLPLFGAGILVAVVGLVLWRAGVAKAASEQAEATESENDPQTLLETLIAPLRQLQAEMGELSTEVVTERVDDLLNRYVLPLAEVRNVLVKRLGMEKGAEILVVVAYGERLLNRVWSAAADGHLPEAQACLPEALEAFEEAVKLLGVDPGSQPSTDAEAAATEISPEAADPVVEAPPASPEPEQAEDGAEPEPS